MFKLIEGSLSRKFFFVIFALINIQFIVIGDAEVNSNPGNDRKAMGLFLKGGVVDSESSNSVDVDNNRSHLNVS